MSNEFNETPFLMGSVVGARTFKVDTLGRLTGVTHEEVFKPGENVGICCRIAEDVDVQQYTTAAPTTLSSYMWRSYYHTTYTRDGEQITADQARAKPSEDHPVGKKDCQCGYYAYTDIDPNQYHSDQSNLSALIEGYGTVTVGSRGFRAGKARLVALVVPDSPEPKALAKDEPTEDEPTPTCWQRYGDYVAVHPGPQVGFAVAGLTNLATSLLVSDQGVLSLLTSVVGACLLVAVVATMAAATQGRRRRKKRSNLTEQLAEARDQINDMTEQAVRDIMRDRIELVRRNYPDVPVYPTLAAAVAEHPLTTIPDPSPEDEDFWTREAR